MATRFTKTKAVVTILLTVTIFLTPILIVYNLYQKRKLQSSLPQTESVVLCESCGKYRCKAETVDYLHNNTSYQVCSSCQAESTEQLIDSLEKSNYLKYLSPL